MYLYGQKFKIIAIKWNPVDQLSSEILWINYHAIVSASWLTNHKYLKQLRKWLETRNDQHTAREARIDYIVSLLFKWFELDLWQEGASIYRE